MSHSLRFSFGPFSLDVEGADLRKGDERVAIRPKCFDLLVYLIENAGRVVSKEELLDKIWSDVVVNDATLNRTVTELRSVLGDDADDPKYVETVSRKGYKFIGEVSGVPREAADMSVEFVLVYNDREFPLHAGEQLIGRGYEVAIPLYGSATSRHHARLVVGNGTVTLQDLGSRNGTFVNGNRVVGSIELRSGDEIRIGADSLVLWSRTSPTASL
ncbi:MAG TPA: winged helix-turn-helix domain-containing protein [Thermoanaerobaculia bacterium]|jgi:DNA-binding winged helix-turn-helix (wHTH) protein|nr:winged helix-turn-helix domain-containing protein [Thermoanaerobaculia bacterium]